MGARPRGEYGFYEAVDYTKDRLGKDETRHIVKSFLAHHQGMSLVAITNTLKSNVFQERFHASPMVKARELLLQERFPTRIPVIMPHQAEVTRVGLEEEADRAERNEHIRTPYTRYPRTWLLSNGKVTACLDNGGGGVTSYEHDVHLNRWREDALSNNTGLWIYLRDLKSRRFWSSTYQPTKLEPEDYEVIFSPDKIEYRRRDMGIAVHTEVTISPEDNVEIRRVNLTNLSTRLRELEITSYGEIALASFRADQRHPAFSKLFVEAEFLEDYDALILSRRPRSDEDPPLFMAHLISQLVVWEPTQFESSRAKFLGRGRTAASPQAMISNAKLGCSSGTVLDPVVALRGRLELASGESQLVCFITAVGRNREELIEIVKRYREPQRVSRAFEMAWSTSDVEIRNQQYSISRIHAFQRLANAILYNMKDLRAPTDIIKKNRLPQSALWRFGISGDEPIVLLSLTDADQLKVAEELLLAHEYLRQRGIRFDLVLLNEYPGGYFQNLQAELEVIIQSGYSRDWVDKRGGIFLRTAAHLSEEEVVLLYSVARVVLSGSRGVLSTQLNFDWRPESVQPRRKTHKREQPKVFEPARSALKFYNGIGGFTEDGRTYEMVVSHNSLPPQPWSNIIANPDFGFLITESGAGFTWAQNSSENRLSGWSNDPITDPFSEVVYLRDQESGAYWCPTPRPVNHGQPVRVVHGFGFSEFSTQVNNIYSHLTLSGSSEEKVKWWEIELVNGDVRERKLEIFLYFEWVLGVMRETSFRTVQSGYDSEAEVLYATNPFNTDFSQQVLFLGSNHTILGHTTSRREFIGRHGDLASPQALEQASYAGGGLPLIGTGKVSPVKLSGMVGGGFDSGCVLKIQVNLAPGERHHVLFFAAQAASVAEAKTLSSH